MEQTSRRRFGALLGTSTGFGVNRSRANSRSSSRVNSISSSISPPWKRMA